MAGQGGGRSEGCAEVTRKGKGPVGGGEETRTRRAGTGTVGDDTTVRRRRCEYGRNESYGGAGKVSQRVSRRSMTSQRELHRKKSDAERASMMYVTGTNYRKPSRRNATKVRPKAAKSPRNRTRRKRSAKPSQVRPPRSVSLALGDDGVRHMGQDCTC